MSVTSTIVEHFVGKAISLGFEWSKGSNFARKYDSRVKVTDSDKQYSFL